MKYFRLRFNVLFEKGENGGCIYDMHNHKMLYVPSDKAQLIEKAEENQLIDENDSFIRELLDSNLGDLYENKVYIEKSHFGVTKEYTQMAIPRLYANKAFIQVTNECEGNCVFCDKSNQVHTKTHCKKWNNAEKEIQPNTWSKTFRALRDLGCETLSFIGGNPFLAFPAIREKVILADATGIKNFEIYTNLGALSSLQLDFIRKYNISLNIQVVNAAGANDYSDIAFEQVLSNIKKLRRFNINMKASVLITRYTDEKLAEIVASLREAGIEEIVTDFFYDNENSHYSQKYHDKMYERQFLAVTRENISYLNQHNSCLYGKVYINLAGEVTPCPMMNEYVCGNILEESINEILSKQSYQNIIYMTKDKLDHCKNCSFKLNCTDCRAIESCASKSVTGVNYCDRVLADEDKCVNE